MHPSSSGQLCEAIRTQTVFHAVCPLEETENETWELFTGLGPQSALSDGLVLQIALGPVPMVFHMSNSTPIKAIKGKSACTTLLWSGPGELDGAQATGPRESRVGSGSFRVGSGTARRVGKYRANGEGGHNTTEAQDERILLGTQRERGSEKGRRVGESDWRPSYFKRRSNTY
ncbi:hypothetical protein B0H16DRAFT_1476763 [Mycena metata]|uniref:Uncharacterized protein n=1 Tax=Mycena metata TaxID=1033252 RepID=A0AAD7HB98_9AGAR|nr:hypothetical protein B0H16DRAFT_1476763 [Mycena metata]